MSVALSEHLPLLASAPDGIQKLRGLILELAVRGKLVPQDPNDEPAHELLKQIAKEGTQQEANGSGKKPKPAPPVSKDEQVFELPDGWAWVRFADVTSYIQRGKGPDYANKSDYVVVSQKCVRWHGLDLSQARWITPESFSKYDTIRLLRGGDVLWNSTGTGTIGRAVVVPSLEAGQVLVADSHVTVVRPVLMSPIYLWRWIQSPSVQREIEGSASGSTNQIELATSTVTAHPLPLPPLAEQQRIVAKVDELMVLCDRLEAEQSDAASAHARLVETLLGTLTQSTDAKDLAANWQRLAEHFDTLFSTEASIDALKQVVLRLAVMGKLVPQNADDEPAIEFLKRIAEEKARLESKGIGKKAKPVALIGVEEGLLTLPLGWHWTTFGQATICRDGERIPISQDERNLREKLYDYYGASGVIDKIDGFLFDKPLLLIGEDGANLINRSTPIAFMARGKYWVNNHAHVIDGITEAFLRFMELYINATDLKPYVTGTAQPKMNQAKMNGIPIAMPPEAEQNRIVAKVDELMDFCDSLKADLAVARRHQAMLADTLINSALEAS